MGHSGAGPTIIAFAVNFPQMTEKLILVDSQMNREESARSGKSVGNAPYVFDSVEAAMAKHKFSNPPRLSWDRERAEKALVKIDKGFMKAWSTHSAISAPAIPTIRTSSCCRGRVRRTASRRTTS